MPELSPYYVFPTGVIMYWNNGMWFQVVRINGVGNWIIDTPRNR